MNCKKFVICRSILLNLVLTAVISWALPVSRNGDSSSKIKNDNNIGSNENEDDSLSQNRQLEERRRCVQHHFEVPKPKLCYKMDCDPLRYYLIKEYSDGKAYFIPIVNRNLCHYFDLKFHHFPYIISMKNFGIKLLDTYHGIMKRFCDVDDSLSGKIYFLPSANENLMRAEKFKAENDFFYDYCKEHYRDIDLSDPNNYQNLVISLHLPDAKTQVFQPYNFKLNKADADSTIARPVLSKRSVENFPSAYATPLEYTNANANANANADADAQGLSATQEHSLSATSNSKKSQLDSNWRLNEFKRYIEIGPHYHTGFGCEKCKHVNRNFLDQFDPCDLCEEERYADVCTSDDDEDRISHYVTHGQQLPAIEN